MAFDPASNECEQAYSVRCQLEGKLQLLHYVNFSCVLGNMPSPPPSLPLSLLHAEDVNIGSLEEVFPNSSTRERENVLTFPRLRKGENCFRNLGIRPTDRERKTDGQTGSGRMKMKYRPHVNVV